MQGFKNVSRFSEILAWGSQSIHSSLPLFPGQKQEIMMRGEKSENIVTKQDQLLINNTVFFRCSMLVSLKEKPV